MRMMMIANLPNEPFNSLLRAGTAGAKIRAILEELKPEAAYFTEQHGGRCAVMVFDIDDQSRIPAYSEPFFLAFNADCRFRIAMTADDLAKAGLEQLGKRWS